jgi:hypothetical protein
VVRVVDLGDQIGDGELELVSPEPCRRIAGHEPEPRAEEVEDRRGLRHHDLPGTEHRRSEGKVRTQLAAQHAQDGVHAHRPCSGGACPTST